MDDSEPDVDDIAAHDAEEPDEPRPVAGALRTGGDGLEPLGGGPGPAKKPVVATMFVVLAMFLVWRLVRRRRKHRQLQDDAALGLLAAGIVEG